MNQNNNTLIELNLDLVLAQTIKGNCNSKYIIPQTFSYKFTTNKTVIKLFKIEYL